MASSAPAFPIRIVSTVVRGFGRGSSELGIPTANLSRTSSSVSFDALPCGIYWGFARIGGPAAPVYKAAISIGYNPTYKNEEKTVEPHLIAPPGDPTRSASSCGETVLRDFYGEQVRLSVVGYIRDELPFEGIDKLIAAIKQDIVKTEELCDGTDDLVLKEKSWVASDDDCT